MTAQSFNQPQLHSNVISILRRKIENGKDLPFKIKTFSKGDYIFQPGKKPDFLYIVKEGRVKIGAHGSDEKEVIKKIAINGEIFGEFSLLGLTTQKDYAITMEKTEVYVLSNEETQSLMRENKTLSNYMMNLLGNRLMEMEQRLESIVFETSRERIIGFLEKLVHKRGQRVGYEMLVRKFFTHQEIANLTATSRQTVTMVLNELRKKNILTFNRRRLLIRDMELLKAEAA